MDQDVQDATIQFIKNAVLKGTRKLDISWYGGEPLLYPEIVESLSRKINAIAQEKWLSCKYAYGYKWLLVNPGFD